ncbi:FkbM family methyltransferase [Labrys sp. 22185]|uniref:FkbM family methyltransferase n=1 Tax=Labrys sp. 22185 TaxID=3453888 RepID=UPI003F85538C
MTAASSLPLHARLLRRYWHMPDHPMKLRLYDWLRASRPFRHVIARLAFGTFKLDLVDYVQHAMFLHGSYEPKSLALFQSLIGSGETVIDLGANIGQYSIAAARMAGPTGRVIAIEPHPGVCFRLLDNIRLSKVEDRVLPVTSPLADATGFIEFGLPEAGALGTMRPRRPDETRRLLTMAVTIAELADRLDIAAAAVMKIDIEGYDLAIIDDMFRNSVLRPRHILFEYLPSRFDYAIAASHLTAYFSDFGYELLTIDGVRYSPEQDVPEENLWARRISA